MAAATCDSDADLIVTVDDIPSELSADELLDIDVAAWMEELASAGDPHLIGEPSITTADSPFERGRVMRWTWGHEGESSSTTRYLFAAGGRAWDLTFSVERPDETTDATFLAIASSFRLRPSDPRH
jgi:hypothetical protein